MKAIIQRDQEKHVDVHRCIAVRVEGILLYIPHAEESNSSSTSQEILKLRHDQDKEQDQSMPATSALASAGDMITVVNQTQKT
jgi:hypothetical protein